MFKFKALLAAPALLFALGVATPAHAVAFKLKNDTNLTLRARAFDRGEWRTWQVYTPGGWGDFAPKVARGVHTVQFEVLRGNRWVPIYQGNHGSRLWTRVAQAITGPQNQLVFAWWDEPAGCRGAPPSPRSGGGTCLKKSGSWMMKTLMQTAVKVGQAYTAGG